MAGILEWFEYLATQMGPAVLFGAVSGGALGAVALAVTWLWDSRRRTVQELLRDGFAMHSELEAWILEGAANGKLSQHNSLGTEPGGEKPWLRPVEVRMVLDQAVWNAPEANFYGIINGRRAWIVRDQLCGGDSYPRTDDVRPLTSYPALLSSKALHELAGWIERVTTLCIWRIWPLPRRTEPIGFFLSKHAIRSLWPLVAGVRAEDRIRILSSRLSPEGQAFLRWHCKKYPTRND